MHVILIKYIVIKGKVIKIFKERIAKSGMVEIYFLNTESNIMRPSALSLSLTIAFFTHIYKHSDLYLNIDFYVR